MGLLFMSKVESINVDGVAKPIRARKLELGVLIKPGDICTYRSRSPICGFFTKQPGDKTTYSYYRPIQDDPILEMLGV